MSTEAPAALSVDEAHPPNHTLLVEPDWPWWRQASAYVASGLRICRKDISGLLALVGLFIVPPLLAVIVGGLPGAEKTTSIAYWVAQALPWITITLGNISMVLAIEALDRGERVVPAKILPAAVLWFPRYIWTNGITTVLFWILFGSLSLHIGNITISLLPVLLGNLTNSWGWPSFAPTLILGIPMLFWHVRLVFATYAAIVDDQRGWRSVFISIGIAHRRWLMVVAAFVGSVIVEAPIALPAYLLIQGVTNPLVAGGFTWVLVMSMRPIFIATLHEIYEDYRPAAAIAESQQHPKPYPRWRSLYYVSPMQRERMRSAAANQAYHQMEQEYIHGAEQDIQESISADWSPDRD
jgi:hypothetical protein